MATLLIYGASDDLVEVTGIDGADEYSTDGHWTGVLESPNGETAMVYVDYRDNGCWTVALGLFEEDYSLPLWPVSLFSDEDLCKYAAIASIEVPTGTTIKESK